MMEKINPFSLAMVLIFCLSLTGLIAVGWERCVETNRREGKMSAISKQFEVHYGVKKCDVKSCPCCGGFTEKYASPQAKTTSGCSGELEDCVLFWRCGSCGCEWKHGQFENK